jgi:hypothetical protein
MLDYSKVVRNENIRKAETITQRFEQIDDLRLDRHVERRHRLVTGRDLLQVSGAAIREIRGNQMAMIFQDPMMKSGSAASARAIWITKNWTHSARYADQPRYWAVARDLRHAQPRAALQPTTERATTERATTPNVGWPKRPDHCRRDRHTGRLGPPRYARGCERARRPWSPCSRQAATISPATM